MPFNDAECFCRDNCRAKEAIALAGIDKSRKAFVAARKAVLKAPNCPHTHGILGVLMTNNGLAFQAERHLKICAMLGDTMPARNQTNLGHAYIAQGNLRAAEGAFIAAMAANPNYPGAHLGLAEVYEKLRDFDKALTIAQQAWETDPNAPGLRLIYGKLLSRAGDDAKALDVLAPSTEPMPLFERGRILEKLGDYDQAFAAYTAANERAGKTYDESQAALRIANHKMFTGITTLEKLPHIDTPIGTGTPMFITGYPRSGTTLFEAMMSQHGDVAAGDELNFIHDIAGFSQAWLGAEQPYPFALNELMLGDKDQIARAFRAYYLSGIAARNFDGAKFMTDKMPMNEVHLPLISIILAGVPVYYVRRNPLDIIMSNFSNYLNHGFHQSYSLNSCANHYSLVDDLLEHYKAKVDMALCEIRYEALVAAPEPIMRQALEFAGLAYDENCIHPENNPNHPRTPSYDAVKQPLNDKSIGRWKNFQRHLEDSGAMRIVEPIMLREGY